ncbi:hypothetical protein [Actinomadura terrae]|uniref:hypothetical protein n=1 Tax=Actinomadura terrae TaxID=604353 RepID=UPI001FA81101|nr:hypothetical protein [Actinomadura terrae]
MIDTYALQAVQGAPKITVILGAVAAVAATISLIIAILNRYRPILPKRQLLYGMTATPKLIAEEVKDKGELKVLFQDQEIEDPRIIKIGLMSGDADFPSDSYDNDRPIVFELNTRVISIIGIEVRSPSSPPPQNVTADGTRVLLGPDLIGKRQGIVITAMVDGEATIECHSTLKGAALREYSTKVPIELAIKVIVGAVCLLLISQILNAKSSNPWPVLLVQLPLDLMLAASAIVATSIGIRWAGRNLWSDIFKQKQKRRSRKP